MSTVLSTAAALVSAADPVVPTTTAPEWQLITAALVGIAVIVVLITWVKLHPFISLMIGAIVTGLVAGMTAVQTILSFTNGFGATMGGVGVLIALGAIFGKLLADSGGADRIVDTLIARSSVQALPWVMGGVGALIGLPMFFEVGLVLLVPVIILVARRSGLPLMRIAIPTLAGLSAMHGLVPPHPGPLAAIDLVGADLGQTLLFGVIVAIPAVIIAGPLFSKLAARWVKVPVPDLFVTAEDRGEDVSSKPRPSFGAALFCILLPVVLMLASSLANIVAPTSGDAWKLVVDFLGKPVIALLLAVLVGMVVLGRGGRMGRDEIAASVGSSLPPIAGILLIVGAGGGFKQVLVDSTIGQVIADAISGIGGSLAVVLALAWLVAVLIRVATGSATVATITAAGILQPLVADLDLSAGATSLLVLAIGSGSVFLSHVNDAGFWLIKEYFGLTIGQTLKSWTVLECLISLVGLAGVLALSPFVA
ncbi:gluconate:H+ symporter [Agromyces sp. H3Y2-19a]|uniref:GntP family permease n=1 Tax=Agromyces TaxID=33877 RepID=UPI001E5544E6|nr:MULTISPECIES: gluconate:H+ symporter [Agromyces]MCD5346184.1 GntP family permease [Agromyces sp. S2-1-8]MDF0512551.1 gluconate:H+ symporter [Agromyces chromiiresistens]